MKKSLLFLHLLFLATVPLQAHGDEVATGGKSATTGYFSTENVSDKYELLLKYTHLDPGQPAD
ncbi:MAG: hypothetical protein IPL27_09925 [Lewinellaceae bacterium]|nr:hypothetical protein [Lewinellaceae bacterium]